MFNNLGKIFNIPGWLVQMGSSAVVPASVFFGFLVRPALMAYDAKLAMSADRLHIEGVVYQLGFWGP